MLELQAQPLTAEAFAEFGDVIERNDSKSFPINAGRTQRHHDLAQVEALGEEARVLVSMFVSQPITLPLELTFLERHPQGSQAFMPLHDERFVVVVAPRGDAIDPKDVCAFLTNGRQGVNYKAGTWHAIQSVLEREGEFLVVDRGGAGNNCEEHELSVRVNLGASE
ncbi:MAG: ureidoglycolate lyase [Marinobacter sp.]